MSPAARSRFAGVIGMPARQSLSPVIHKAWLQAAGIDADYLAFEAPAGGFARAAKALREGGCLGLNVTIPFKEDALAFAGAASEAARAAGAANLLVFGQDGVRADNTDGLGLLAALEEAGWRPGGEAVVLGAGGAARGATAALVGAGASRVTVVNRTLERAQAITALDLRVEAASWDDAPAALASAGLLVNATSLGMAGQPPLELDLAPLPAAATVMDMVYRPLETPLLAAARRRGHPTADGLAMLIAQARPSFEALFGRPPPAEVDVRALCEAALKA